MNQSIQKEIEKYFFKKNVYFHKFSDELIHYLFEKYPCVSTLKAKWYMLKNNLQHIPICAYTDCDMAVKWNEKNNKFDHGCCIDHNKRITSLKNHGTEHPNQSKKQQRKVKKSIQEKYGVDYITQTTKHRDSVKNTVKEKYGVDNVLQSAVIRHKIKKTNIERYGVENPTSNSEIREKVKQTNMKRYGVSESLASPKVRSKGNKTNIERYGSAFPMRNEVLLSRRRQTIIEKYDAYSPFADETIVTKFRNTHWKKYYKEKLLHNKFVTPNFSIDEYVDTKGYKSYEWSCKQCNTVFIDNVSNGNLPRCPVCFPKDLKVSKDENHIFESLNVKNKIQTNKGLIENCEIDIYLPDYRIGIECNGMYLHSEQKGIDKYYHLDKTILSENNGIFLIHIFESEWISRPIQTISMIKRHIEIFDEYVDVNDVCIKPISEDTASLFLRENSLNFTDSLFERRFGAFKNEELVSIMTVKKINNGHIICKFVEKNGVGFTGNIFSKMVDSIFDKTVVYYYPDRRYTKTNERNLIESGFSFEGGTEPDLIYSKNLQNIISSNVTKTNITTFTETYDERLNIYENMIMNGYLSVWDCGRLVYKKAAS